MTDRVADFLARFEGPRARKVHDALREIDGQMTECRVVIAELAYEVRRDKLWNQIHREDGTAYPSARTYFDDVLDFKSRARLQQYIAVGKFLHKTPSEDRPALRLSLAGIGMHKAEMIASVAKYRPKDVGKWIERAMVTPALTLRKVINEAVHPQGRTGRGSVGSWPVRTRLRSHLCALGVPQHLVDEFYTQARAHGLPDEPKALLTYALEKAMTWTN